MRVCITDDDFDFFRAVKRSHWWTLVEIVLITYALMGNEIFLQYAIGVCQGLEADGQPPLEPGSIDNAVGWANLVLFFFFLFDMVLQFCIMGTAYVTNGKVRFILDLMATVLLLPSSKGFDWVIFNLALAAAGGDRNTAQTIIDNIQQGTVARISRVARMAGRLTRAIKAVSAFERYLLTVVMRNQSKGRFWLILAKTLGVADEAAQDMAVVEKEAQRLEQERLSREEREAKIKRARERKAERDAREASMPARSGAPAGPEVSKNSSKSASVFTRLGGLGTKAAAAPSPAEAIRKRNTEYKRRKELAMQRASEKANETSPSQIGTTIIEKMTSELVFTILLLLIVYSTAYDLPAMEQKTILLQTQLRSLVSLHRAGVDTASAAFQALLDALLGNSTSPEYLRDMVNVSLPYGGFPTVLFVKVAGATVFNLSQALNYSYPVLAYRRPSELIYVRVDGTCEESLLGMDVGLPTCKDVIVYDRQRELQGELSSNVVVTWLNVAIIMMTVMMMAVDMQHMLLNPIDRLAKFIKTITGRHWRKNKKKEGDGNASMSNLSLSSMFEAFEVEAYYGLKTLNLFLLDLEQAFGVTMGKQRQKLFALEHWVDKLLLTVNRAIAESDRPEMTLDDLFHRFHTFWQENMHATRGRLGKLAAKKPVAKLVRFVSMLEEPRMWLLATLKESLLRQMRDALGETPNLKAGRLAVLEIRAFIQRQAARDRGRRRPAEYSGCPPPSLRRGRARSRATAW